MHHCAEALSLFKQSQCERKSSPGASWECFREAEGCMFAPSSGSVFGVLLATQSLSCTHKGLHPLPLHWCSGTAPVRDGELWDGGRLLLLPLRSTSSSSGVGTRTHLSPPACEEPLPSLHKSWECIWAGLSQALLSLDPFCLHPALPRAHPDVPLLRLRLGARDQPTPLHHRLCPGEVQTALRAETLLKNVKLL